MDVRCNRCATEYDFDDALISERGTTVKCTNCGFQFKVFPPDAGALAPERWVVRTGTGEEHVFTSLRELQRGITDQKVGANDLLSRGKEVPRPLGAIAELEQFFLAPRIQERVQRTLHGVAPPGGSGATDPKLADPRPADPKPAAPKPAATTAVIHNAFPAAPTTEKFGKRSVTAPLGTLPESNAVTTLRTDEAPLTSATGSMPMPARPYAAETLVMPPPQKLAPTPAAPPTFSATLQSAGADPPPGRGSNPELGAPLGQLPELRSSPRTSGPTSMSAVAPPSRRDFRSYDELSPESIPDPSRRARSRWIAAVVVAGVVTLFALTVGRRYLVETRSAAVEPARGSNTRVAELLKNGTRLLDEGQLDDAGEQLTKASALAEKDPDVLAALARLSVLRADVSWLKLRLLDPKAEELVQATHRELGRGIGKARTAVDAAFAVAPENITVLRARVDALRLSGDHETAREWIKPIASQPSDPANAYVLAALDLAEATPSWPSVVDRLETAASGERVPGRAHAALVYALTRSGKIVEARTELSKLETNASSAVLFDELKSFVARHEQTKDAGVSEKGKVAVDPSQLGRPTPSLPEPAGASAAGANDFRRLLEQAAQAMGRGDYDRAKGLYQQVLDKHPGNTEALAGLGDVARHRNDPTVASRMYERVLADNPNYLPALIASADQKWDSGDRQGAVALYRRVLDQSGPSTEYGRRASARIAQAATAEEPPRDAPPTPTTAPAPSAAPPEVPESPPIDTTDLPETK